MRKAFIILALSLCVGCAGIIALTNHFMTEVTITGKIIERYAVPDKYGDMNYYVLVNYGNTIRQENGLKYYVKPVGSTVKKTMWVFK